MKKLLFFVLLLGTSITHLHSMEEGGAREHRAQLVLFPHPSSDGTTVEVEQGIAKVIFTHLATLDSENLGELYRACKVVMQFLKKTEKLLIAM